MTEPVEKVILQADFWAKKSGKHGSGKFHHWKDAKASRCGGSPGKPTVNRRAKMPYLHCSRCASLLKQDELAAAAAQLNTPAPSVPHEAGPVGHPPSGDGPLGST